VRVAFDVVEDDDGAIAVGQAGDRAIEIHADGPIDGRGRYVDLVERQHGAGALAPLLTPAVDRDAAQPRSQRRLPGEPGEPLRRPEPGVLQDFLGRRHVAGREAQREGVQRRRVAAIEIAKRRLVSLTEEAGDELAVGSGHYEDSRT